MLVRKSFFIIVFSISSALLSCSSTPPAPNLDELLTTNKAGAQKTAELVNAVLKQAFVLPVLKDAEAGAVQSKLGFTMLQKAKPGETLRPVDPAFNAIVLEESGLPAWASKPSAAVSDFGPVSGMFPSDFAYSVELALSGTYNGNAPLKDNPVFYDGVKNTFAALPKLRYVLVIHTVRAAMPERTATDTFSPGVLEAEARLFDLQSGTYLGGFAFSARTDATIVVNANHYDSVEIKYNLVGNVEKALKGEMARRGWI